MATQWGRKETIIWPPYAPIRSYSAVGLAMLLTCFFAWQHFRFSLTTLQQSYSGAYVRSLAMAPFHMRSNYRLLYLGGGKAAPRLALPIDFTEGQTELPNGRTVPVALSELATAQGFRYFYRGPEEKLSDASVNRWLRGAIFEGKSLVGLYAVNLSEGAFCLAAKIGRAHV